MSKEEWQQLYRNAVEKPQVRTSEGLQAAAIIAKEAEKKGIEIALAGGIAMHFYGFQRATSDVDLLASDTLGLPMEQKLSFGGESYQVQIGEQTVTVDVIVRDDFFRGFYDAALRDAKPMPNGGRVITPEWMAILKYLSGRSKDTLDLLWLLSKPGMVDRKKIADLLEAVMGAPNAQAALRGLDPYYLQADVMRARDEQEKEK